MYLITFLIEFVSFVTVNQGKRMSEQESLLAQLQTKMNVLRSVSEVFVKAMCYI